MSQACHARDPAAESQEFEGGRVLGVFRLHNVISCLILRLAAVGPHVLSHLGALVINQARLVFSSGQWMSLQRKSNNTNEVESENNKAPF